MHRRVFDPGETGRAINRFVSLRLERHYGHDSASFTIHRTGGVKNFAGSFGLAYYPAVVAALGQILQVFFYEKLLLIYGESKLVTAINTPHWFIRSHNRHLVALKPCKLNLPKGFVPVPD